MVPKVSVDFFFDRRAVYSRLETKERQVLSATGAFHRRAVQQSMRPGGKKNKVSEPGQPPRWHTKLLRNGVLFAYDPEARSVIVGVMPLRKEGEAPSKLQTGGNVTIAQKRRVNGVTKIIKKQVHIAARPYIGPPAPTYNKTIDKMLSLIEQKELI